MMKTCAILLVLSLATTFRSVSAACALSRDGACVGTGCSRPGLDGSAADAFLSCEVIFKATGVCGCVAAEPTCSTCNSDSCPDWARCVTPKGCLGPPCSSDGRGGCPGRCEAKPIPAETCGGISGVVCADGYECVDVPDDDCDPDNGGSDCAGTCVKRDDPCAPFQFCIALNDPVCGTDGTTYSNQCQLNYANCKKPIDIAVACRGTCPCDSDECPQVCPAVVRPVCGKDGKTYNNQCELNIAACKSGGVLDSTAACTGSCPCKPQCDMGCPDVWKPVCGKDGRTYGNQCELDFAACRDKSLDSEPLCEDACPCGKKVCGGLAGTPCADGEVCLDDPDDSCDPDNGGADCLGFCAPAPKTCSSCGQVCDKGYFCKVDCRGPPCLPDGSGGCEGVCLKESSNCDIPCDDSYEPVCGSDGITYSNRCQFNVAVCRNPKALSLACEDACDKCDPAETKPPTPTQDEQCPFACTLQYDPVCGTDGVTYGNSCALDAAHCKDASIFQACAQACPCESNCDPASFPQQCSITIKLDALFAGNPAVSEAINSEFCREGFAVSSTIVDCVPQLRSTTCAKVSVAGNDLLALFAKLSAKFDAKSFRGEYLAKWVEIVDEDCSEQLSASSTLQTAFLFGTAASLLA